jgi:hypothetical protein
LELHTAHSPVLSQAVQPVLFPLLLQHFPPLQTPDVHTDPLEHVVPSNPKQIFHPLSVLELSDNQDRSAVTFPSRPDPNPE